MTFASGAAVNLAARLEQAAGPGEALIGPQCHRLVRDVVEGEARPGLVLKGLPAPVTAFRLRAVWQDAAGPVPVRPVTRLLGRSRELALLQQAYERAATDRTCQLVTVLGTAGAGKSRLAAEFLAGLDAAGDGPLVLRGWCLSYGSRVNTQNPWPSGSAITTP